ncbi:MAG: helix-turn-helix domain-containing protein, partial [Huintestinicola sp.]
MDNLYGFGGILRELREKKGLTQAELGVILGVAGSTVSKY